MQYVINRKALIYDLLDGDIVIIHLESGNYYNLSGSGALTWQFLTKTVSFDGLVKLLAYAYDQKNSDIEKDLQVFLDHLEKENLVVQSAEHDPAAPDGNLKTEAGKKEAYLPPVLDVFTDMQDFLLVDPIHEVDENGLPKYTPQNLDDN